MNNYGIKNTYIIHYTALKTKNGQRNVIQYTIHYLSKIIIVHNYNWRGDYVEDWTINSNKLLRIRRKLVSPKINVHSQIFWLFNEMLWLKINNFYLTICLKRFTL